MKRLNKLIVGLSLVFLMVSSCSKDLALEPISLITNSSFWKSEDDAQGALNGMYVRLRAQAENFNLLYLGEARSETLGPSLSTGPNKYWENVIDASNPGPDWLGFYSILHDANSILKYVPNIAFASAEKKNNVLAQAYSMRAYVYFVLSKSWGDLNLVTEPTEQFGADATQTARSSKEDVFKLIKQDIDQAAKLFSNNNFPAGRNLWSLPALNALKADVYLWTAKRMGGGAADLNTALTALNAVQASDVQLLSNYTSIFSYSNKGNKEVIMAIRFQELESGSNWGSQSHMITTYLNPNIDAASRDFMGALAGTPSIAISNLVRAQFEMDDQRRLGTFYEVFTTNPATGAKTFYMSYSTKYRGFVNAGGSRLFADNIVLYRYADILLMKAEAKNALGQDPTVEMNLVRARAYGANFSSHVFASGSAIQNDEAILKERLLELTYEGKRWWDLIRFGKAFELVPSLKSRATQTHLLLFPLSESTLSLNPKLKQNPGY
jgi:hypothetical protein